MATYLLRPSADTKAQWVEDPVGTAFSVLDDAVTQPTAPTTGSDRITSATNGDICTLEVPDQQLLPGESVTQIKLWVYIQTAAGRNCQIGVNNAPAAMAAFVAAGTAFSWNSVTYTGNATQAQLNSLQISLVNGNGAGTTEVDAAYIELTTRAKASIPSVAGLPSIPSVGE